MMKRRYIFRSAQTPAGFLGAALDLRVSAALLDTVEAGMPLEYDPLEIETTTDAAGEKVEITLIWGEGVATNSARDFIDAHDLIVEPQV